MATGEMLSSNRRWAWAVLWFVCVVLSLVVGYIAYVAFHVLYVDTSTFDNDARVPSTSTKIEGVGSLVLGFLSALAILGASAVSLRIAIAGDDGRRRRVYALFSAAVCLAFLWVVWILVYPSEPASYYAS